MNYVAKEVLRVMRQLQRQIREYQPVRPEKSVIPKGLQVSKNACKQETYVHPTPVMKNAMIIHGDVKQTRVNGEWQTSKFPASKELGKAATALLDILKVAMLKELGAEIREYPDNVPFIDPTYYVVDCWNFYDEIRNGKFWDIQPGQEEQLKERFSVYSQPKTNMSLEEMIKFIETHPTMQKTLEIEQKIWPMVKASRDITAISDPFMSKKSGVSYPDFANDSKIVPGKGITYGKYEIQLAQAAYAKGDESLIKFAYENNVFTGYTRRQLGKGRALIAESRRSNLVFNMVNGVEMEKVKSTRAINIPFIDEDQQLEQLSHLCELCIKNNLLLANIDASAWDQNLGQGPLVLQDAERYILGQGEFTKKIITARTICNTKAHFINGPENRVHKIYGRQFSGYDDTTLGNTKANRTTATCSALESDERYVADVIDKLEGYHIITVGDDLLVAGKSRKFFKDFIDAETRNFKLVIHGDEKFAIGCFFIQWRVFKYNDQYVMAYNVPRVFRSMLSKEDAKHLGRGGWTLAFYQQLGKVSRYKPALKILVNIIAAYDQYHLSLDLPVSKIIEMVKEEDKQAQLNDKSVLSTSERMYKSNPNIAGLEVDKDGKVSLDASYFEKLQAKLKEVYDPNYLPSIGFANPDLNLIH